MTRYNKYGFIVEGRPNDAQVMGLDQTVVNKYRDKLNAWEYAEYKLSMLKQAFRDRLSQLDKLPALDFVPEDAEYSERVLLQSRINYTQKCINETEKFLKERK